MHFKIKIDTVRQVHEKIFQFKKWRDGRNTQYMEWEEIQIYFGYPSKHWLAFGLR